MKNAEDRVKSILSKASEYKTKRKKEGYTLITCACTIIVAVIIGGDFWHNFEEGNSINSSINNEVELDAQKIAFNNLEEIELITFKTKGELIKKMKSSESYKNYRGSYWVDLIFDATEDMVMNESAQFDSAIPTLGDLGLKGESASDATGSSKDYSDTNVQVQGVDESDIVKTNGDFIYYLTNNSLKVFDNTGEKLKLIKEINYNEEKDEYIYANELYLSDKYVIVFANSNIKTEPTPIEGAVNRILYDSYYYGNSRNSTKVLIYDANTYELVREIETEGGYVSSRKVDDDIYLITNKYVYYREFNEDEVLPLYKDTCVASGDIQELSIENVRCFPSFEEDVECSYMIITSFDLDKINERANIETFIGTGSEIYCSRENLYVTKVDYNYEIASKNSAVISNENIATTRIRKFAIYDSEVKYVAEGEVPGVLVNQFSMDEYNENFRITTTTGNTWDDSSENNLYVLDKNLDVMGKLEGLAKGEKIYSTRFMGDKCYVVTYKTVDPLFVLDLSSPENPKVLGELKIPGYSKYLHPLGENYLIGFGEDSVEKKYTNYDGTESVTAYATGLKLAIFDVTDYNNPKELYTVKIGGRGSSSPLLYNHKSLLFKEDEGLFAFPAILASENGYYENGVPKYGKTEFNGILVFDLSIEEGIKLRGKVSNDENEKYYNNEAQRVIYIDDKLYSLFNNMIKVNDRETIEELDVIKFK